ncbi:unnamed protein product, partial [Mesorhabditis spiculigera]
SAKVTAASHEIPVKESPNALTTYLSKEVFCAHSTDAVYETQRGQNLYNIEEVAPTRKISLFYSSWDSIYEARRGETTPAGKKTQEEFARNFATRPDGETPRNGVLQLKPEMVNCSESGNLLRKLMKWSFAHPNNIHEKGRTSPQKECLVADFASEVWSAGPTISGVVTQRGSLFHEVLRDPPASLQNYLIAGQGRLPESPPHPIRRGRKTGYGPGADRK